MISFLFHEVYCYQLVVVVVVDVVVVMVIIIIIIIISHHRPILPGNSLEPTVIPTVQASSFTLQYFLYYV
jgi:hypothetical protein